MTKAELFRIRHANHMHNERMKKHRRSTLIKEIAVALLIPAGVLGWVMIIGMLGGRM